MMFFFIGMCSGVAGLAWPQHWILFSIIGVVFLVLGALEAWSS